MLCRSCSQPHPPSLAGDGGEGGKRGEGGEEEEGREAVRETPSIYGSKLGEEHDTTATHSEIQRTRTSSDSTTNIGTLSSSCTEPTLTSYSGGGTGPEAPTCGSSSGSCAELPPYAPERCLEADYRASRPPSGDDNDADGGVAHVDRGGVAGGGAHAAPSPPIASVACKEELGEGGHGHVQRPVEGEGAGVGGGVTGDSEYGGGPGGSKDGGGEGGYSDGDGDGSEGLDDGEGLVSDGGSLGEGVHGAGEGGYMCQDGEGGGVVSVEAGRAGEGEGEGGGGGVVDAADQDKLVEIRSAFDRAIATPSGSRGMEGTRIHVRARVCMHSGCSYVPFLTSIQVLEHSGYSGC